MARALLRGRSDDPLKKDTLHDLADQNPRKNGSIVYFNRVW